MYTLQSYNCFHEYAEGYQLGAFEVQSRMSIFKSPVKVNLAIEVLGIFDRSARDRLEINHPQAAVRKLGYLDGVYSATLHLMPYLSSSISPIVMNRIQASFFETLLIVMCNVLEKINTQGKILYDDAAY